MVFFGIGLFKRYRIGLIVVVLVLLVLLKATVILEYLDYIDYLNFLTPFWYFHSLKIASEGIHMLYLIISAVVVGISIYLTNGLYNRRDLLT